VFEGWYTQRNGGGTRFTGTTVVTANLTVYAKWLAVPTGAFVVTFDADGGSPDITHAVTAAGGGTVVLPTEPVLAGHSFQEWHTGRNGAGTLFDANTQVTRNITVYAKWVEVTDGYLTLKGTVTATHTGSGWAGYPAMTARISSTTTAYNTDFPVTMFTDTGADDRGSWMAILPPALKNASLTLTFVVSAPTDFTLTSSAAATGAFAPGDKNTYPTDLTATFNVIPFKIADGTHYPTLSVAMNASAAGTKAAPSVVTVLDNVDLHSESAVPSGKHIKIVAEAGQTYTLKRYAGVRYFMIRVPDKYASFTLGRGIILDGNRTEVPDAGGAGIYINAGAFVMEDGATIQNCAQSDRSGGGVHISSGSFVMNGGLITNNSSTRGGGVFCQRQDNGLEFIMNGGTISGNQGAGVAGYGIRFVMNGGTITGNSGNNCSIDGYPLGTTYAKFGAGGGKTNDTVRAAGYVFNTTSNSLTAPAN
jgi:uncharacterized repeat protein (TIGR02543 family)